MSLSHDATRRKPVERALLAVDIRGRLVVLATDSPTIAWYCEEVGSDPADFELWDNEDGSMSPHCLHLWSGTWRVELECWDAPSYATECVFDGTTRPVTLTELTELMKMEPPVKEDGDGDRGETPDGE